MRAIKTTTTSILAIGLLVGSAVVVVAQDEDTTEDEATQEEAMTLPAQGGVRLEAGTYTDDSVGHQVTFDLPGDWLLVEEAYEGAGFLLSPTNVERTVAVTRFEGNVHTEPCYRSDEPKEGDGLIMAAEMWLFQPANQTTVPATVEGFWEHLQANPHLTVDGVEEVQVAGHSGMQGTVRATITGDCDPPDVFIWAPPAFTVWLLPDSTSANYTALDVDGDVIVVAVETFDPEEDVEVLMEEVAPMIDSLSISPAAEG